MEKDQELKSLKRGLRVLIMLSQHRSMTISEAARKLGLARTTAERVILTLESEGFVERVTDGKRYSLTPRVLALSGAYSREDHLIKIATPMLFEKTREIGWPLAIAAPLGERMSVRVTTDPATALWLHKRHVGSDIAMAACSGGIVHLAFLEDAQREELIEMLQQSDDPSQILARDRPALDAHLNAARRDGFSLGLETGPERAACVPLLDHGQIRGVLVMIYMTRAVRKQELLSRFVPDLKTLAAEIEKRAFEENIEPVPEGLSKRSDGL